MENDEFYQELRKRYLSSMQVLDSVIRKDESVRVVDVQDAIDLFSIVNDFDKAGFLAEKFGYYASACFYYELGDNLVGAYRCADKAKDLSKVEKLYPLLDRKITLLEEERHSFEAGMICEKAGFFKRAIANFKRGGWYSEAKELEESL